MTLDENAARLRVGGVEMTLPVRVQMTPRLLAEAFAEMSDEEQAQFFIDVADIASSWESGGFGQWYLVGRHLRTCSCATDASREVIAGIARGIGVPELTEASA